MIKEIVYYTDPLCCWSWAMEPSLSQLRERLKGETSWRYCMCGLIPDWKHFVDPVNAVQRPVQMGPVWMHAQVVSGVAVDTSIWFKDPPSSSYPGCIAVKCVELQDPSYVPLFLANTRRECMSNGSNIAREEVLYNLADQLQESYPGFDTLQFRDDLVNGRGRESFRADLREVQAKGINRFPSLLVRKQDDTQILLTGYQSYQRLFDLLGITDED